MDLLRGWKEDADVEKLFAENDLNLIKKLSDILDQTQLRENQVGTVADKLYRELEDMDKYLVRMVGKNKNSSENNIENKSE